MNEELAPPFIQIAAIPESDTWYPLLYGLDKEGRVWSMGRRGDEKDSGWKMLTTKVWSTE